MNASHSQIQGLFAVCIIPETYRISMALNIRTSASLLGYKKLSQCISANQRLANLMNLLFKSFISLSSVKNVSYRLVDKL